MSDIVFKTAWRRNDPQQMEDAKEFWARLDLVQPAVRDERAKQIGVLAYLEDQVVAVTTAELVVLPGLRARFAVTQIAVVPDLRLKSIGLQTTGQFLTVLEAWSARHPEEKVMGMAAVIQADQWGDKKREPVWTDWGLDIALTGYTPRNEQIRIAWFRHARV